MSSPPSSPLPSVGALAAAALVGAAGVHIVNHLLSSSSSSSSSSCCNPSSSSSSSPSPSSSLSSSRPLIVTITGAAGQIGYSIVFMIASGRMLGPNQRIELRLLDLPIPQCQNILKGIEFELSDCAYPTLSRVVGTSSQEEAFTNCDIALLIGARPRTGTMDRKDLLSANANIFKEQGQSLDKYAKKSVKVLVVGNPANTNALIAMKNAPSLPPSAFSAMTRLDQNRAVAQVAQKIGTTTDKVKNVLIWGNHSNTQFPDVSIAKVISEGKDGKESESDVASAVNDEKWLQNDFITTVQKRGGAVMEKMGKSSAASAANAAVDHVRDWHNGTEEGRIVSMAIPSDGNSYGVPDGLIFSFPCICKNGKYEIVKGIQLNEFQKEKLRVTAEELQGEKKDAGY